MGHRRFVSRRISGLLVLAFAFGSALLAACSSNLDPVNLRTDYIPPQVSQTNPDADAQGVSTQTTITVTFSEAMDAGTIHAASFRVSVAGAPVPGTIAGLGRRFTFDPDAELPFGSIDVVIDGVADEAGNRMARPYPFSFSTDNSVPPPNQPRDPDPSDGATDVPIDQTFSWQGGGQGTVRYDFWLGTSPDNLSEVVRDLTGTSYQPGTLPYSTQHFWKVVARSQGGEVESAVWSFTTQAEPPPPNDPPSPPAPPISPPNHGQSAGIAVDLTWSGGDDPDGDPVTYDVRLGTVDPPPFLTTVTAKTHHVDGLAHSTHYFWQIVANDDHGHQVAGPVWEFDTPQTPNQPPAAPCNPQPTDGAKDVQPASVTLTWECGNDPDGDPVLYDVYLEKGDSTPDRLIATVSVKSHTVTDLDGESTYYWRIEARDDRGGTTPGPVWSFQTARANRPPSPPCNPDPSDGQVLVPTTLNLKWFCGVDPDGDREFYDIYLGNTPDPPYLDTTTERSYRTNLEALTTYYWRIVARDELGAQTSGPVWSFTTGLGRSGN